MYTSGKRIAISTHAAQRMMQRGATVAEVEDAVRTGTWRPAERGKQHARKDFSFGGLSPVNNQPYRYKAVDAVFADEPHAVVVVTVKVFYHN